MGQGERRGKKRTTQTQRRESPKDVVYAWVWAKFGMMGQLYFLAVFSFSVSLCIVNSRARRSLAPCLASPIDEAVSLFEENEKQQKHVNMKETLHTALFNM